MARIIPVRPPFSLPAITASGSGTINGGSGLSPVTGFTPEAGFALLSTGGSLSNYGAIRITDSSNRLTSRVNNRAYQVWTWISGNTPDSNYSRDTSSYVVSGSRVTTTTGGIAVPTNSVGMLATSGLADFSKVTGPQPTWTGSGAQKTMAVTEEYIGWDMVNDSNVHSCKIFRWAKFDAPTKSYYNGIGNAGFGDPGYNITQCENSQPGDNVWAATGEYPEDRQGNWNTWMQFLRESSANDAANAQWSAYFNGVMYSNPDDVPGQGTMTTKSTSFPGNYNEISLGYQFSNSPGIASGNTIAMAFAMFDTEHGGIAFWSPESSIASTWSSGDASARRAIWPPNGCAAGQADFFHRYGQFSSVAGLYCWFLDNTLTFHKVGRMAP